MPLKKTLCLLYIIGQIIELIGGYFIFRYGVFRPLHGSNSNSPYSGIIQGQIEDNYNKPFKRLSAFGFILVVIGIALQFPIAVYNYLE